MSNISQVNNVGAALKPGVKDPMSLEVLDFLFEVNYRRQQFITFQDIPTSLTFFQHCPTFDGRPSAFEEDQRQCLEHQLCWLRQDQWIHFRLLLHLESRLGSLDPWICSNRGSKCARQFAEVGGISFTINLNILFFLFKSGRNRHADFRAEWNEEGGRG
jgi:hypothetical protein